MVLILHHDVACRHREPFIEVLLVDVGVLKHPFVKLLQVIFLGKLLLHSEKTNILDDFLGVNGRLSTLFQDTVNLKLLLGQLDFDSAIGATII